MYIYNRQRDTDRDRQGEIHSLVHAPNALNNRAWARSKSEGRNCIWVSHMGSRVPTTGFVTAPRVLESAAEL